MNMALLRSDMSMAARVSAVYGSSGAERLRTFKRSIGSKAERAQPVGADFKAHRANRVSGDQHRAAPALFIGSDEDFFDHFKAAILMWMRAHGARADEIGEAERVTWTHDDSAPADAEGDAVLVGGDGNIIKLHKGHAEHPFQKDGGLAEPSESVTPLHQSNTLVKVSSPFDGALRIAATAEAPAQVAPSLPCAGAEGGL